MIIVIVIALVINLVISLMIASSAKSREVSSSKVFWVSFLLTPLLGMFIALMSRQLSLQEIKEKGEEIKKDSRKLLISGSVLFSIIFLSVASYFIIVKVKGEREKEEAKKKEVEMNNLVNSRIKKFEKEGKDTTRDFRMEVLIRMGSLLSKETEEFLYLGKIPSQMSQSEYKNLKRQTESEICLNEIMDDFRRAKSSPGLRKSLAEEIKESTKDK